MLYLGHMLVLGIIKSSSFFMWHPKVNSAYSIPHLMNHRTIHRNIKEKLPKNVLKWEKVRKSEKKWKKVRNWEKLRKIEKIWLGTDLFKYWPNKNKKNKLRKIEKNWEKLRKIEKNWENVSWKKTQIATRGEDETMHQRLGTGVDYMIVLQFVPSPTLSFAQVCVTFFPKTEHDPQ